ncbi:MAG: tetratricopeptide repeat protein, partial [Pseudanabaena sp. SU_2_4]|nr:tetratricopeptide repeat protein [Pseudanabaena sp. SU_2_4]
ETAVELQPNYYDAWYNYGNIFVKLDRYQEAISCYEQAIALNPKLSEAATAKAFCLKKLRQK